MDGCENVTTSALKGQNLQPTPYNCPECTVTTLPIDWGGGGSAGLFEDPLSSAEAEITYGKNVNPVEEHCVSFVDPARKVKHARLVKCELDGKEIYVGFKCQEPDDGKSAIWKSDGEVEFRGDVYRIR